MVLGSHNYVGGISSVVGNLSYIRGYCFYVPFEAAQCEVSSTSDSVCVYSKTGQRRYQLPQSPGPVHVSNIEYS